MPKVFLVRRKNVWTVAKNAVEKAWQYAYIGTSEEKRHANSMDSTY